MVVQTGIQAFESASLSHVVLAGQQFLCRASEHLDRSGDLLFFQVRLECDRCTNGAGADQVVTAAMSVGDAVLARHLGRQRLVAEVGGNASNSTRIPRTGEPLPQVAIHEVSMPPIPWSLILNPFFSSTADS